MEKEYLFWDSNGREFSMDAIQNLMNSDTNVTPDTDIQKWLTDKGYTWREKNENDPKGFEFKDITQEQFDNFADENEAAKILKNIYGDKFEFTVPGFWAGGVGKDYIKVKSHDTGRAHNIYLNTEFNQSSRFRQDSLKDKNLSGEFDSLLEWMKAEDSNDSEIIAKVNLDKNYGITNPITLLESPEYEPIVVSEKAIEGKYYDTSEGKHYQFKDGKYIEVAEGVTEPIQLNFEETQMMISTAASIMDAILLNPQQFTDPKTGEALPIENTGDIQRTQDYEPYHEAIGRIVKNELKKVFFSGDEKTLQMYMGDDVLSAELAAKYKDMEIDPEVLTQLVGVGSPVFEEGLEKIKGTTIKNNAQTTLQDKEISLEAIRPEILQNIRDTFYGRQNQNGKNRVNLVTAQDQLVKNIKAEKEKKAKIEGEYKEGKDKDKEYINKIKNIDNRILEYEKSLAITRNKISNLPTELLLDEKGEYVGAADVKEENRLRQQNALSTIYKEQGGASISTAENLDNVFDIYTNQRLLLQRDALNDYITLDLSKNFTEDGESKKGGFMLRQYRDRIIKYSDPSIEKLTYKFQYIKLMIWDYLK